MNNCDQRILSWIANKKSGRRKRVDELPEVDEIIYQKVLQSLLYSDANNNPINQDFTV